MFPSSASFGHTLLASFQSCTTGLFAPTAPSTNSSSNWPILIESKKDDAADVARAAYQIRVLSYISDDPREGYDVKRTVSAVSLLKAQTNLAFISIIRLVRANAICEALTPCTADSLGLLGEHLRLPCPSALRFFESTVPALSCRISPVNVQLL